MATSSASQYGSGSVEDLKSKAKQAYDDASDRAQEMAGQAKQQASEVAGNVKGAIDKSVKEQPVTTLLAAAAVGFVIGALWKS
ncbi:DUF883 family protein [Hyphomicrobium sp. B1]|jgi:ElaB/YqjD/DUF883 family membrane-anchored ribosome-binding protein|uniref:DUF883 family protein n=1 Tax=unclassified Hyphomicrobium TaxID=2619925 RepID=UPI000213E66A|nr:MULTISPECIES: DUF883 family protein [unclassified Hyphomicrobium]CCB65315.1 conserved protein of unknown function [Hyphomicrobium sp. MC1]